MNDAFQKIMGSLGDYWNSFLGVIPRIALSILIVAIGILLANWLSDITRRKLLNTSKDPLMTGFLVKAVKMIFIITIIMIGLQAAGLKDMAGGLLAAAGASAVVLGFAFKDIAENFLAGIILAFSRPFYVNDTIKIDDTFGKVKSMQFRYTKIKTFDGRDVYIPNSDVLKKPVINYTEDGFFRIDFIVGIAYEDDIEKAKNIIRQVIKDSPDVIDDKEHTNFVAEDQLAASTVNLKVFFWVDTVDFRRGAVEVRGEMIQRVKNRLMAEKFNLPADIIEIKHYAADGDFPVGFKKRDN